MSATVFSPAVARWVFFLSGTAALLYQIVWQRLLVFFSGSDVYSSTLVVAAFMAGLGVGYLTGGAVADRVSRRTSLLAFGAAELAIAVFGLLSAPLFYGVLYQRLGPLDFSPIAMTAVLFVSLLWPTFFMGVSLPLLARAMTEAVDRAAAGIGTLYGLNTLGAAVGALGATWLILPRLGLGGSLWIAAATNLVCAVAVLWSVRRSTAVEGPAQAASAAPATARDAARGSMTTPTSTFAAWAAIYALSGFLALSLEIVWFRLLGVIVKSTAFTFGTLLAIYLAGLGAGSLTGARFVGRVQRPATAFLNLQGLAALSAGALLVLFVTVIARTPWFASYFAVYEPLDVAQNVRRLRLRDFVDGLVLRAPGDSLPWESVVLYLLVPVCLIGLPTFLMGLAFPVLQRVVQTDLARLGRRVGLLLLANIAGSVAGALLTGWVALDVLGAAGTVKALVALGAVFVLLALRTTRGWPASEGQAWLSGRASALAIGVGLAATALAVPDTETLWARLHGTAADRLVIGEDATGLSVLRVEGADPSQQATVFVNGLGQSAMPYGSIHTALGMLPVFIHPAPKDVAVIGLGSGDTAYAAAGRPDVASILCVEIIRPQLSTLTALADRVAYGGLHGLLGDSRVRHIAADGRLVLMRSEARFDVIEADALRPTSAYSGNLYSDGYFELVRSRLRPGGLAVTWSPTRRVHETFVRVFPHVVVLPEILLGSNDPLVLDREAIAARLRETRVRDHYARAGVDVDQILATYLVELARYTPDFDRSALVDINTDLFPRDELDRPAPSWRP